MICRMNLIYGINYCLGYFGNVPPSQDYYKQGGYTSLYVAKLNYPVISRSIHHLFNIFQNFQITFKCTFRNPFDYFIVFL